MKLTKLLSEASPKHRSILTKHGAHTDTVWDDNYDISYAQITSLEGAPTDVRQSFNCNFNHLTSLKFAPRKLFVNFFCANNALTSLEDGPTSVNGHYNCGYNPLKSLKGAPYMVGRSFICTNGKYKDFEGAPEIIGTDLVCTGTTTLKSLHNIHKHIKQIHGRAVFDRCPIKSHVLGLLKIENLKEVILGDAAEHGSTAWYEAKPEKAAVIINKHLKGNRNIFDCQAELEDAGLEEFAQL